MRIAIVKNQIDTGLHAEDGLSSLVESCLRGVLLSLKFTMMKYVALRVFGNVRTGLLCCVIKGLQEEVRCCFVALIEFVEFIALFEFVELF